MPRRGQGLQLSDRVPCAMRTADMDIMDMDVFCMVKETLAASGLCQDPLLVMPGTRLQDSKNGLLKANCIIHVLFSKPPLKGKGMMNSLQFTGPSKRIFHTCEGEQLSMKAC